MVSGPGFRPVLLRQKISLLTIELSVGDILVGYYYFPCSTRNKSEVQLQIGWFCCRFEDQKHHDIQDDDNNTNKATFGVRFFCDAIFFRGQGCNPPTSGPKPGGPEQGVAHRRTTIVYPI